MKLLYIINMLTIEQTKKILWNRYSYLTDKEIETIRDEMLLFWITMLED